MNINKKAHPKNISRNIPVGNDQSGTDPERYETVEKDLKKIIKDSKSK